MANSQDIRKIAYGRRKALDQVDVKVKSEQICTQLLPYLKGKVALYCSYGHEVSLSTIIKAVPYGCELYLPKVIDQETMIFYQINEKTKFVKSAYGIDEPLNGNIIEPQALDVMVVPVVAFDSQLHRIGHGKGYYDRYLSLSLAKRIGVAFECQRFETIPCHTHDEMMDLIISEVTVYK